AIRVLKEWVFIPEPVASFQYRRQLDFTDDLQVKRLSNNSFSIWRNDLYDQRPFVLSTPKLIREFETDLDGFQTYYKDGVFTTVLEKLETDTFPLLIEREWSMPAPEALIAFDRMDEVAFEAYKNQFVADVYQSVPFSFESNLGQFPEDGFFSAHKNNASYFLNDQEIVSIWFIPYESQQESLLKNPTLFQTGEESATQDSGNFGYGYGYESAFVEDEEVEDKEIVCRETRPLLARLLREQDRQFVFALLRQQFLSTERTKEISSGEIERATTHYFQGDDVSSWRVGVESTQMVQYTNLYPSIDLQILSDGAGLTQSFVVHPGGNPEDIRSRW